MIKKNIERIILECNNIFNEGIKQNYFDNNKTASEHTAMLLNIFLGVTMTALLPTDSLRNASMLNPTLVYTIFLKK